MDALIDTPPRGFKVTAADDGGLLIQYRTTGSACVAIFFVVWLTGWSLGTVGGTCMALFAPAGVNYLILLFMVPFWIILIFTLGFVAWFFFSVTNFVFEPEELIVERQLLRYRRRGVFRRSDVKAVRQVKDGGEGSDSYSSWALVIVAASSVKLLSRQPIEKSDWFGPVVAKWAGVSFEPAQARKYEEI